MKKAIHTDDAPAAIGPYSQAIIHNGLAYISGQIPFDPKTMTLVGETIEEQTHQVMKNLGAVLEAAGSSFDHAIKCSIFLADMGDFATVNEIYAKSFGDIPPARETVAVKTLPKEVRVEISMIAEVPA
jgi:2-iminobutanoate/2-iminopropanoate deaminase